MPKASTEAAEIRGPSDRVPDLRVIENDVPPPSPNQPLLDLVREVKAERKLTERDHRDIELWQRYQLSDSEDQLRKIKGAIIERHQDFIDAMVLKTRAGNPSEDDFQEGALEFAQAFERWNPKKAAMTTYGGDRIFWKLRRNDRDQSDIPRPLWEFIGRMLPAERALRTELGREPTDEEMAAQLIESNLAAELGREPTSEELSNRLKTTIDTIREARAVKEKPASLDALISSGYEADRSLHGAGNPDSEDAALDRILVRQGMKYVTPRQGRMILGYFYLELTQTELAQREGLSQMQVSRDIRRGLTRMFAGLEGPSGR